jgi:hypothetical protein
MLLVPYAKKSNKIFNLFPAPRQDSDLESLDEGLDPHTKTNSVGLTLVGFWLVTVLSREVKELSSRFSTSPYSTGILFNIHQMNKPFN